jgi:osmotically-inducible protein OsmY
VPFISENKAKIRVKVKDGNVTLIGAIEEEEVEALERAIGEIRVEDLVRSVENKTVVRKKS